MARCASLRSKSESEQMLAHSQMITFSKLHFPPNSKIGAIGRTQISQRERSGRGISLDGRVATAHEGVGREDEVAKLPPDHHLVPADIKDVANDPLHGALGKAGVPGLGWRAVNVCPSFPCRPQV